MVLQAYSVVSLVASIICLALIMFAFNNRRHLSTRLFMGMLAFVLVWTLACAMIPLSGTIAAAGFWHRLVFIAAAFASVFFFYFVIQYTGYEFLLPRKYWLLLLVIPLFTSLFTVTNESHHLMFVKNTFVKTDQGMNLLARQGGPWMIVHLSYSYLLTLAVIVIVAYAAFRRKGIYKSNARLLLWCLIPPVSASVIWATKILDGFLLPLAPLGLVLSALILAADLFRFSFLKVVPVARARVFEVMRDAVVVADTNGVILDLNKSARELLQKEQKETIGKNLAAVSSLGKAIMRKLINRNMQTEDMGKMFYWDLSGKMRCLNIRVSPVDEINERDTTVLIIQDVTEQHKVQEEIHRHATTLEQKNKDLNSYSHTVAHDLKAPLKSMIRYSQMVLNDNKTNLAIQEHIPVFERAASKMYNIISVLLQLSQVSEVDEVEFETFAMNEVLRAAKERVKNTAEEAGGSIWITTPMPAVYSYAPWVEEVWVNYLSNALMYGGEEPSVEVSAEETEEGMVRFCVRDFGQGMDEEGLKNLFNGEISAQVSLKSNGLGLSIVQRIVRKLGGEVGVESKKGEGTTFYFELPQAKGEE